MEARVRLRPLYGSACEVTAPLWERTGGYGPFMRTHGRLRPFYENACEPTVPLWERMRC
jgi:hypothetical protein